MTVAVMNAWQLFLKGGPMMWPILLLSVAALAIGINRFMVLSAVEGGLSPEKKALLLSLRQGHLKETLRLCEERPGTLSAILKSGILKFGSSGDVIRGAMEEALSHEVPRIKEHMGILSLIVNAAPLMGLLGTVNAMTVVFHAVVVRSNVLNPLPAGELASGIWQALLTTSAGLTVGILSFTCHSFCALRINAVIAYLERSIVEMNNMLQQLSEPVNQAKHFVAGSGQHSAGEHINEY
ncbi:MAG: MotA/TolQ/ExbB proton channel family protein [Candidatus Omnitrophica bacterium]|nr:MotA/TolQ/ExbB proton channel family protein [Candidatus Omnitrophota bacterium]